MARTMEAASNNADLYAGPEYAQCVLCGRIGKVRHSASPATAGMITRCLHAHCYRETRFVYLCDGFSDCAGAHRAVVHPIECRAGGHTNLCTRPVLDQKLVGATLRDTPFWLRGFYCLPHMVAAKRLAITGNQSWAKLPESAGYGMETGP